MKKILVLFLLLSTQIHLMAQSSLSVAEMIQIQQEANMRFANDLLLSKGYQRFDGADVVADSLSSKNYWYAQYCELDDHFFPVVKPDATASVVEVMNKSHYFVSIIVYSKSRKNELEQQILDAGYQQETKNLDEQYFTKGDSYFYIYPNSVSPSYWTILLGWQIDIDEI